MLAEFFSSNIKNYTIEDVLTIADGVPKIASFTQFSEKENIYIVYISVFHCIFVYREGILLAIKKKSTESKMFNIKLDNPRDFRQYVKYHKLTN